MQDGVKWSKVELNKTFSLEEYPMLMGKYLNSIDIKFRMIVPAKFRSKLEYKCVLTRGIDHCLYIYPMDEWEILMGKLSSLPMSDPDARAFVRHFYANAVECDIDKQGRITIPQELRDWAGIKKDLVTLGLLNRIEIWGIDSWKDADNKTELDHSDFAKKMIEYGI